MRVLHVGSGFRPLRLGGLVAYIEELMDEQVRRGDDVAYFFSGRYYPLVGRPRLKRWRRGLIGRRIEWGQLSDFKIADTEGIVFLEHEQNIPFELDAHEGDESRGNVRVGIDPRPRRQPFRVSAEFRGKRTHGGILQFGIMNLEFGMAVGTTVRIPNS